MKCGGSSGCRVRRGATGEDDDRLGVAIYAVLRVCGVGVSQCADGEVARPGGDDQAVAGEQLQEAQGVERQRGSEQHFNVIEEYDVGSGCGIFNDVGNQFGGASLSLPLGEFEQTRGGRASDGHERVPAGMGELPQLR